MADLLFSPQAQDDLKNLPTNVHDRIYEKLHANAQLDDPLVRAKSITKAGSATHRFRIGDYRPLSYIKNESVVITAIDHHKDVYR